MIEARIVVYEIPQDFGKVITVVTHEIIWTTQAKPEEKP